MAADQQLVRDRAVSDTTGQRSDQPSQEAERDGSWSEGIIGMSAARLVLVASFLAAWQWLPDVDAVRARFTFMDPFFISSPSLITQRIWDITTGANDATPIWSPLFFTLYTSMAGTAIAIAAGAFLGLLLSNSRFLERLFWPFIVALNAVPRIAIVPIIVILVGSAAKANIVTAVIVVFFLVFYNALEGGRTTPIEMIENAKLLGAGPWDIMRSVRLPLVLAWTSAAVPNAIAFGLVGAVTTEIFTGGEGIGQVLSASVNTADATLTFSVVVILTVVGVALVLGATLARRLVLPWWGRPGTSI